MDPELFSGPGFPQSFGDGNVSTDQHPQHIYSYEGNFLVNLTASNYLGSDSAEAWVNVSSAAEPPVADFTATPTSGYKPLTVEFTDESTGSPSSWSWTFGDSGTSTQQNPSHEYTSAGTYTVQLTATNDGGNDTEVKEDYITVEMPTYSMTLVWYYYNITPTLLYGPEIRDTIRAWLGGTPGWDEKFYHFNSNVDDSDFGTDISNYQGLDEAVFHYHYGHGENISGESVVKYTDYPASYLSREEIYKKWDLTNKWVVFDACEVLSNLQWGGALKYSHGILGFATEKTPSIDLPDRFIQNCIDNDQTIAYAWEDATKYVYGGNVTARVIFDTDDQLENDHLAGQGTIAPDEYPDDDIVYWSEWTC